jgi:hypothetical protein
MPFNFLTTKNWLGHNPKQGDQIGIVLGKKLVNLVTQGKMFFKSSLPSTKLARYPFNRFERQFNCF